METVTEAPRRPLHRLSAWLSGVETGGAGRPPSGASAQAASPPLLSSSVQISPQKRETGPEISYAKGGNFARVRLPGVAPTVRGDREAIRKFSPKSRRAMLRLVNSIDQTWCKPSDFAFVTLTYPKEFPSAAASKPHLDQFIKRFEREWGDRWMIWKLEPQKRGAPHYHLLVYMGAGFDPGAMTRWVALAWHEIAGNDDPNHLKFHRGELGGKNRPCVESVRDWQGVANYAGKYLGKICDGDEEWQHPGRYWGQRRSELAPITIITQEVSRAAAVKFKRVMVRLYEKQKTGWYYLTGRRSFKGKDKPGRVRHGIEIAPGKRLSLLTPEFLKSYGDELEREIRPQFRKWRGRQGGCSLFMSAATATRLLAWALIPHPARQITSVV